jgi:hypothetical protein
MSSIFYILTNSRQYSHIESIGYHSSCLSFVFYGTGIFLIQGFMLARQVLYCLSHSSFPFCYGYFGDRIFLFTQTDLDRDSILSFLYHWDDKRPAISHWDGILQLFFPHAGLEPQFSQSQPLT